MDYLDVRSDVILTSLVSFKHIERVELQQEIAKLNSKQKEVSDDRTNLHNISSTSLNKNRDDQAFNHHIESSLQASEIALTNRKASLNRVKQQNNKKPSSNKNHFSISSFPNTKEQSPSSYRGSPAKEIPISTPDDF